MRRRTMLKSSTLFGIGALSNSILSGCNQPRSKNFPPLRVGVLLWFGCEGMFLAGQKGLFTTPVKQKYFSTVTELYESLVTGKLDLAAVVATDLLVLNERAPNMKTIMVTDYSGEVDGILASNKITKPEDLRGKRFARENVPYEIVFVGEFLKLGGMTEKDVQIVSMTAEEGAAAFAAGKVDAVATYDPYLGKALKQRPDAKLLFTPKQSNIIPNAIAAHGQVITERRHDVKEYLRSVDKGLKYSAANRTEVNRMMAKWLSVSPEDIAVQRSKIYILDVVKNKIDAFNPSSPLNVADSIRSGGQILLETGRLKKMSDAASIIDGSLIRSLSGV
jgi:NitT/TauT family transport system substrate-binding protein